MPDCASKLNETSKVTVTNTIVIIFFNSVPHIRDCLASLNPPLVDWMGNHEKVQFYTCNPSNSNSNASRGAIAYSDKLGFFFSKARYVLQVKAPDSVSLRISSAVNPSSLSTNCVCCPQADTGAIASTELRLNRGAGAACCTPSCV